jgi:hypothetical protein
VAARDWPDQKQPSRESIQKKRSRQWARLVDRELGGHFFDVASPRAPAGGRGVGIDAHGEPQRAAVLMRPRCLDLAVHTRFTGK